MSLWIIHSGICILVSETTVRPASTQEVLKKQTLELRPSRQRRRSIYVQPSEDDKSPFSEDVLVAGDLRGGQAPFVDARPTEDAGGEDVQEVERDLAGDFGGGKAGARMELHYAKETEEIQAELVETMKKEWSNWEKYSDGKWITKAELDAMKEESPAIKAIGGPRRCGGFINYEMRPTYGLTNNNGTGVHPVSITADRSIWRRHFCRIPPRIKLDGI